MLDPLLCMLYTIVVGTCLALAGVLVERVLPARAPRRWLWCGVIVLSMAVPPLYRMRHTSSLASTLEHHAGWWAGPEAHAIFVQLWLVASALVMLSGIVGAWRVSRVVRRSEAARADTSEPTVVDGVPVVVTESVGPATVGFWRSRVLVPRWVLALPTVARRYVLRHEEEHRRCRDGHLLFAASLLLILAPWHLALWWQLRRLSLAVELDCDDRVVAALGDATRYGEVLLAVAHASSRGPRLQPAFLGGAGTLERRLVTLVAPAALGRVQRWLLPALAIALVLVVLALPHPVP